MGANPSQLVAFGLELEQATAEAKRLLHLRDKETCSMPQDVKDLLMLSRAYRWESLQHQYRCKRLAEHVLHLHSSCLAHVDPSQLPSVPEEIEWYINIDAVEILRS